MNKFLIILFLGFFANSTISQENIKLVYSTSSQESLKELANLTSNNKKEYKSALAKYHEIELEGKIILSSKEYEPIKTLINNYQNGQSTTQEEKVFAEKAMKKYISITELISK